jgi:hypothetical protein
MSYNYVNRTYGTSFKAGQRVKFTEDGRLGTIKSRRTDDQYVDVKFDNGGEGPCHPASVDPLVDQEAERRAADRLGDALSSIFR